MTDLTNVTAEWTGKDWRTMRSDGYARAALKGGDWEAARFDAPLISSVNDIGEIWQGGCVQGVDLGDFFPTVVSLYPWERYAIADSVNRVEVTMYDSSDGVLEDSLFEATDAVLTGLETGRVLIHCQAGLNRSGLVTAFSLMRLGQPAQLAIDMLRANRSPLVLCNQTFVKQLHDLEHHRSEWE